MEDSDKQGDERGVQRVVIVELKKPTPKIRIGEAQKAQAWKYVKELHEKGAIQQYTTRVTCYVLGTALDPQESDEDWKWENTVEIVPMTYQDVLARARSRTFKLLDTIRKAQEEEGMSVDSFLEFHPPHRKEEGQTTLDL